MATQSAQFDLATAFLDQPKTLAYGLVRGAGNLVFQQELASKNRIAIYLLGEGPWDSLLRLWINRKQVTLPDTTLAHFHQGLDGEIGFGMGASSNGPDQHVDAFWGSVTGTFSLVTWSRYAYLALNVAPDPAAPSPDLEVLADYQATKCRIFDASGVQTSFAWTQNPAWWICDFLIRKFILREAKVNQPLVAAELARFDWQSFVDAAAYYDADIGGGIKRFSDGGLVFLDGSLTADSVLEQKLLLSRSYLLERNGKLSLYADKPRASVFTFTIDNIEPLSFKAKKSNLRNGKNRISAAYRNIGLASGSTDDATRFAIATQTLSHEAHQKAIGARGPGLSVIPKVQELKLDYGNNTAERVARLVQFQLTRQLGDDTDPNVPYVAPFDFEWIGFEDSIAVEPGDVVTIDPSISEEFGGKQVEVLEPEYPPDGRILYGGKEYQPNAFTDIAPTQQQIEAPVPGTGLAPVTQLDGSGNQIVSLAKTIDGTSRFARTAVHSSFRPLGNYLTAHDAGTNATINLAAGTNRIGATDVSVNSGSITALSYSTLYFVYYDDPTLAGGSVSYAASTTKETAIAGSGRFFWGSISTPAAGAPDTKGNNDGGVGAQIGGHIKRFGTVLLSNDSNAVLTLTNSGNATDKDFATSATLAGTTVDVTSEIATLMITGFGTGDDAGRIFKNIVLTLKVSGSCQNESNAGAGATSTLKAQRVVGGVTTTIRTVTATGNGGTATLAAQTDVVTTIPDGAAIGAVQVIVEYRGHVAVGTANDGNATLNAFEAVVEADF